jgi:uncharacterized protein YutE (UPF0331/DUF86 family)
MPRFDQEKVATLISQLRKSCERLRMLSGLGKDVFLSDPDKIGSSKYHFIVAIESCIDLCNHLISRNGFRIPESYGDTFVVMCEVGALDPDFANDLKNMAKLRNRLVHLYWEVDDVQLYGYLCERLGDFKSFLNAMATFLKW